MKKAILIIVAVLLITPVVIYFAFPGILYEASLRMERKKAGLEKRMINVQDHKIVYLVKDQSYNMASQALRLDQFVTALKLDKFHLAGNSMGGTISGRYAALFPDKVLTLGLIDTAGVFSCEKSELFRRLEKGENPMFFGTLEEFDETGRLAYVQPPSIPTPIKRFLLKQAIADRAFNEKIFNETVQEAYSMETDFTKIRADTFILWGDKDHFIDVSCVKTLENGIKNSTAVIMKNCGHIPMMERPEEAAKHYLSFLKE